MKSQSLEENCDEETDKNFPIDYTHSPIEKMLIRTPPGSKIRISVLSALPLRAGDKTGDTEVQVTVNDWYCASEEEYWEKKRGYLFGLATLKVAYNGVTLTYSHSEKEFDIIVSGVSRRKRRT